MRKRYLLVGLLLMLTACGSEPVDDNREEEQNQEIDEHDCVPTTCEVLDAQCGTHDDGCDGTVECGSCGEDMACSAGQCVDESAAEPPTVIIHNAPDDPSNSLDAAFSFSCDADDCAFECSLDEATSDCTSPQSYTDLAEGGHLFAVRATDSEGQTGEWAEYEWTISLGPPEVIDLQGPADPTSNTSASFDFDCSKPGCEFSCRLDDGDFAACTPGISYDELAEGDHRFEVFATDSLGVESEPLFWEWTIDTAVPDVIDLVGPDNPTNETSATFGFGCSKEDCTFECSLDGADFSLCEPGVGANTLADGVHQFRVRATDELGTTGGAATWNWTVDTIPPEVVINEGPAIETFETNAEFWFGCPDNDCVSLECALDTLAGDGIFETCSSPLLFENLELGIYNLNVRGTDAAGNIGEDSLIWEIVEDTSCPEGQLNCNCYGDQTCGDNLECVDNTCVEPQCASGQLYCSGQCIDPQTNDEYCGTCDISCGSGQSCQAGECQDTAVVSPPVMTLFAGGWFSCKQLEDDTLTCWGQNNYGQRNPPDVAFSQVSLGTWHGCGIEADNTANCWGKDFYDESTPPPGEFLQVDAGVRHSCGVKLDGSVECWGRDNDGQSTPLGGEFSYVSGGGSHTCGLRPTGVAECWGANNHGQADTPAETFTQLSTGGSFNCGITADDTLYCWGTDAYGASTDYPTGTFTQVSAGGLFACAVSTTNDIECWGLNNHFQADPPGGYDFVEVSAGEHHACGLTTDDAIVCWGSDEYGQIDVPAGL